MSDKSRSEVTRLAAFATDLLGHVILLPVYLYCLVLLVVETVLVGSGGALIVLAVGLAHKWAVGLSVAHPVVLPLAGAWGAALACLYFGARLFQAISRRED